MNQLNITPALCLTKHADLVSLVDESNGIVCAVAMPQLEGVRSTLTWQHPLSLWHNAKGLIAQPHSWLAKQEKNILAGLLITTYKHYGLLEEHQLSGVELNAILSTAEKDSIIKLLMLATRFNPRNVLGVGNLVIDWHDVSQQASMDKALQAYYNRIRPYFIRLDTDTDTAARIKALDMRAREGRQLAGGQCLSGKQTLSNMEKEFDSKLQSYKRELKALIATAREQKQADGSTVLTAKQVETLLALSKHRNLVTMSDSLRANIKTKLAAMPYDWAQQIGKILEGSVNPYDRALVESGLERASEAFAPAMRFATVAEMLAYRRSLAPTACEASHVANSTPALNDDDLEDLGDDLGDEEAGLADL